MIADLRADSARWRQEQRTTGTRGSNSPTVHEVSGFTVPDLLLDPYEGSQTYHNSAASGGSGARREPRRGGGDSPIVDGPYTAPPPSRSERERERIPASRVPAADRMDIDPPVMSPPDRRYPQERGYPPDPRAAYQPDSRAYPADSRAYQRGQPPPTTYGPPPVTTAAYSQDPRYAPSYPPSNDSAPPGYVRQGDYYVPVSSSYDPTPIMPPSRSEPPQYGSGPYGQPPAPPGRDPRDPRDPRDLRDPRDPRDPRYGQPEAPDPRYAYPSPAATVSSVSRDHITSPQQPRFAPHRYPTAPNHANISSGYGPQYDQYGRRKYR